MPDRYHIHTAAMPARFRRTGKFAQCRLARGLLPLQQLRQAPLPLRRLPARIGVQPRPAGARRDPGRMQSLPLLRTGLHQGAAERLGQPRISEHGRRILDARHSPHHLEPGRYRQDPGLRGGLSRPVSRPRFRFHLDGHVGNRPPHARRHTRARVHLDQRGYRPQAAAPEVHARRPDVDPAFAADRDSASGDSRHAGVAGGGRAPGRGAHRGGEETQDAGGGSRRRCRAGAAQAIAVSHAGGGQGRHRQLRGHHRRRENGAIVGRPGCGGAGRPTTLHQRAA